MRDSKGLNAKAGTILYICLPCVVCGHQSRLGCHSFHFFFRLLCVLLVLPAWRAGGHTHVRKCVADPGGVLEMQPTLSISFFLFSLSIDFLFLMTGWMAGWMAGWLAGWLAD
jgi:hypothetical protein